MSGAVADRVDLKLGDFVALASHRDTVFAARDDRVDVFQADGNSLDLERSALITGIDDITDRAAALLGLPTWYELASVEQGNLTDDLLVGGGAGSTVYYDDTAL